MDSSKNLPRVGVAPDKRQKGIDSLSEKARMFDVRDFNEALQEQWAEDAHFVAYSVRKPDGKQQARWPRINKPCLGELIAMGARVECNAMVLDYDTNMNVSPSQGAKTASP